MTRGREVLATLRPVRASLRVTFARWLLWIGAALPGIWLTRQALARGVAREPYFVSPPSLDVIQLFELARRLRPMLATLVLCAGATWLGLQLLTAGAAIRLDPARRRRMSLWRAVWDGGSQALLAYLRVALLAAILCALGWLALARAFAALGDHGEIAGWTGKTLVRDLPLARAAFTALWLSAVGVFAFWLRIGIAAEERPRMRALAWRTLRLCARHPVSAFAFHWTLALGTLAVQSGVLLAWRTSTSGAPTLVWGALWLAVLLVSAYTWQWRVRAALCVWRSAARVGRLADVELSRRGPRLRALL